MKVLIICGSIAKQSHTHNLLMYLEGLLKAKGAETVFWDLQTKPLPIALPEYHRDPMQNPGKNVKEFVTAVDAANAFVLGTPLYHGSYSGVLKNALDNLYYDAFRNKTVALVSHGHSMTSTPCEHLRSVVRTLYGYALQSQICTAGDDYATSGSQYILENEEIKERCQRMADELIQLTRAVQSGKIEKED